MISVLVFSTKTLIFCSRCMKTWVLLGHVLIGRFKLLLASSRESLKPFCLSKLKNLVVIAPCSNSLPHPTPAILSISKDNYLGELLVILGFQEKLYVNMNVWMMVHVTHSFLSGWLDMLIVKYTEVLMPLKFSNIPFRSMDGRIQEEQAAGRVNNMLPTALFFSTVGGGAVRCRPIWCFA